MKINYIFIGILFLFCTNQKEFSSSPESGKMLELKVNQLFFNAAPLSSNPLSSEEIDLYLANEWVMKTIPKNTIVTINVLDKNMVIIASKIKGKLTADVDYLSPINNAIGYVVFVGGGTMIEQIEDLF